MTRLHAPRSAARPLEAKAASDEALIGHLIQDTPVDPVRIARVREQLMSRYRDAFIRAVPSRELE